MAEPVSPYTLDLRFLGNSINPNSGATSYTRYIAEADPGNQSIDDELLLRWNILNEATTGFTLRVTYVSADGLGNRVDSSTNQVPLTFNPQATYTVNNPTAYYIYTLNTVDPLTFDLRSMTVPGEPAFALGSPTQADISRSIKLYFTPNYFQSRNFAPINIAVRGTRELTTFSSTVRNITASAFQDNSGTLDTIAPDYNLRWTASNARFVNGGTNEAIDVEVAYINGGTTQSLAVTSIISDFPTFINTPTEFRTLDINNPIDFRFTNVATGATIANGSTLNSRAVSSIGITLSGRYTAINFAPTNLEISATRIDNRYFIRSLTAVIMQQTGLVAPNPTHVVATGQAQVRWQFDSTKVWAARPTGLPYATNTNDAVSAIGTMVFYTSAERYNFTTRTPRISTFDIQAFYVPDPNTSNDTYTFSCDEFPDLNVNAFLNFENSNNHPYFLRLTSPTPYPAVVRAAATYYDLNTNPRSSRHDIWFTINDTPSLSSRFIPSPINIIRNTPTVSSIQVYLSSGTPAGLEGLPWFTSHIFTNSISAKFVPYFLSADFVGWPGSYFKNKNEVEFITNSNDFVKSPGLFFYGEGHTDTVTLCAKQLPLINRYLWNIKNLSATRNEFTVNNITSPTFTVRISSDLDQNIRLPISLHVLNSEFLSTDPYFYFDDNTGAPTTYPYYISTLDINGNPSPQNNRYRDSIWIRTYDIPPYTFIPGINRSVILPSNGRNTRFKAFYSIDQVLFRCYDKYGVIWKWSTFENCSADPFAFTNSPSSWSTMQCTACAGSWPLVADRSGQYPKKWRPEGGLSAELFDNNPVTCSASPVTWTLSSSTQWSTSLTTTATDTFEYYLRVQDFGTNLFTTSYFTSTNVVVNVKQTVTCKISATNLPGGGDWLQSDKLINETFVSNVGTTPDVRLYTPNRFVLTGTDVPFENLITQKQLVSSVDIDFEDGNPPLTGQNVYTGFFTTKYNTPGKKTINVTLRTNYQETPIITPLTDGVRVVSQYDQVSPTEYRSITNPIELPWPEQPAIGSNDWAVKNNINSCFEKIYQNLEYLESRGKAYSDTFSDYFGYVGAVPTSAVNPNACLAWTWEDVDCLNTALPYTVTWRDVLSADNELDTGKFVNCGQWSDHLENISTLAPNCLGLHDVEWSWKSRKSTASIPTFWKDTKLNARFSKKWYYEPSTGNQGIICTDSIWHVNLPNLNKYYPNIENPNVQPRCIFYGVTSKNNTLYLAQKTQIKLLSSDYEASFFDYRDTLDNVTNFSSIKNICLDDDNKIYILDSLLSQIVVLTYESGTLGDNWKIFTTWGGYGGKTSKTKFLNPNDIHIDQLNNVWVSDTGNKCVKHYSNTGTWLKTISDENLDSNAPISLAVDGDKKVHVLTKEKVYVYSYVGEYLFSYETKSYLENEPRKIIPSFNREILYISSAKEVIKFFKNGVYTGLILRNQFNVNNITGMYHDEFRNLLITTDDKILKYCDLMTIKELKGSSPDRYWNLNDIYIHEDEYVQNWVYTKSFQRMWDNIELFRNSLFYNDSNLCKQYTPPPYTKDKISIGQNEIVTSTAINRVLGYLWDNFTSLIKYFDPNCK